MIIAPYLGFLIDWISMSDCSYGDMPVIGLINIWFPVERLPPPTQPPPTTITTSPALFSSLSFCLWHRSERMGSRHIEYQVADWGCHSGPQWSLVARCACPLVSTAGFVSRVCEGLSGRTGGVEEVAEQSAVPSLGPATHAVFFSIHHCQWTAEAGVWWLYLAYDGISHATCSTWNKSPVTHAFDWRSPTSYRVMTPQTSAQFATEIAVRPTCFRPRGAPGSMSAYSSGIKGRTFFVLLIVFVPECYSNVAQCERHT